MKTKPQNKHLKEQKIITKCIFKGLKISQIAELLNYSPSTVSNRIKSLFKTYKVKDRIEFILRVFNDVIIKYDTKIEKLTEEIESLKNELEKLKNR